jgi:hypothetical protein
VLVEPAVLDRQDRLLHAHGDRRQRDGPALLTLAAERGQHRRVEKHTLARLGAELDAQDAIRHPRRSADPSAPRRRLQRRRRRALKDDADDLVPLSSATRGNDRDRALDRSPTRRLLPPIAMRVAELVERSTKLLIGHRLAAAQLELAAASTRGNTVRALARAGARRISREKRT